LWRGPPDESAFRRSTRRSTTRLQQDRGTRLRASLDAIIRRGAGVGEPSVDTGALRCGNVPRSRLLYLTAFRHCHRAWISWFARLRAPYHHLLRTWIPLLHLTPWQLDISIGRTPDIVAAGHSPSATASIFLGRGDGNARRGPKLYSPGHRTLLDRGRRFSMGTGTRTSRLRCTLTREWRSSSWRGDGSFDEGATPHGRFNAPEVEDGGPERRRKARLGGTEQRRSDRFPVPWARRGNLWCATGSWGRAGPSRRQRSQISTWTATLTWP